MNFPPSVIWLYAIASRQNNNGVCGFGIIEKCKKRLPSAFETQRTTACIGSNVY